MAETKASFKQASQGIRLSLGAVHVVKLVPEAPLHTMARLRGALFDKDKAFLLPTALEGLESFRKHLDKLAPNDLLIVGHTDTTADKTVNDPLSKERAIAVKQYLEDDFQGWLENYAEKTAFKKRWGSREDRLMAAGIADAETRRRRAAGTPNPVVTFEGLPAVRWFQKHHNEAVDAGTKPGPKLTETGKADAKTREALVKAYMEQDGPSWIADKSKLKSIAVHGAGENFPLDGTGLELDQRSVGEREGESDRVDRRAELFFFDSAVGIKPPPGKPDGPEYLEWRKAALENVDLVAGGVANQATQIELEDALFRTNSAVVMPEGEAPAGAASGEDDGTARDGRRAFASSIGAFSTLLRFNEEHPGRTLLISGHTDTAGREQDNQKLSEDRGLMAKSVLMGDREAFKEIAHRRHKVGDYKQILKWASITLTALDQPDGEPEPLFDFASCDPGKIDEVAFTGIEPLRAFQRAYTANKKALGAGDQPDLEDDGDIGKKTWGAIFDCYQFALRQELGEDAAGMDALRKQIAFLIPDKPVMGFGEKHPIDGIGKDNFRSQDNRRVELLLFEPGEEPDLALLQEAPEDTELYLPNAFSRIVVPPLVSAKRWFARWGSETVGFNEKARAGLIAAGLPAGTPVKFTIEHEGFGPIGIANDVSKPAPEGKDGPVSVAGPEFGEFFHEPAVKFVETREAGEDFPPARFRFFAEAGGRRVKSNLIAYDDNLEVVLKSDDGLPSAEEEYVILTPWGARKGKTGKDGLVLERRLPPGGCAINLNGNNPISAETFGFL